jgi:V-type H+-transporting ATPase subunit H
MDDEDILALAAVRERRIAWADFQDLGFLSSADAQLMIDLQREDTIGGKAASVSLQPDLYCACLLRCLLKIQSVETREAILVLMNDLIDAVPELPKRLLAQHDPFTPFSRMLRESPLMVDQAARILAHLISALPDSASNREKDDFIGWLVLQLRKKDHKEVAPAINALVVLMRNRAMRSAFVKAKGGRLLPPLIRSQMAHMQTLYHVVFSLWLLTFDVSAAKELHDTHVAALCHDVLLRVTREKIVRVALMVLHNLVKADVVYAKDMLAVGMYATLKAMKTRRFGDADVTELVDKLFDLLDAQMVELSSFDAYNQEVLSGRLDWTPPHRAEKFWRENMDKFEAKDFAVVQELVKLLGLAEADVEAADARTVAVVCHDLGEFVRHHARGKKVLNDLDAKTRVMKLMTHKDEEIRKEALLAVQKMMVQKWDYAS